MKSKIITIFIFFSLSVFCSPAFSTPFTMKIDDTSGQNIVSFAFIFDVSDNFSISDFSLGGAAAEWTVNKSGVETLVDGSTVLKIDAFDLASLMDMGDNYLNNGILFSFNYVGTLYVDPIRFAELTYDDDSGGYNLLETGEYKLILSDTMGELQQGGLMQAVPSPSTIVLVFTGFCFITGLTRRQKLAIA